MQEPGDREKGGARRSSGCDTAIANLSSQQLQFPVQDWACHQPITGQTYEELLEPQPSLVNCWHWWILGEV